MGPRRIAISLAVLAVVAAVLAALVTGGSFTAHRGSTDSAPAGGTSSIRPRPARPAPAAQPTQDVPEPVLTPVTSGPAPRPAKVRAALDAVDDSGVGLSGAVLDVATGARLYARRADSPVIPASTMKLLTSAAALQILGPEHTFTTRVVSASASRIVLVGGGDPYLASRTRGGTYPRRSSVADLAKETAAQLRQSRRSTVSLGYDDSLFTGPDWNRTWPNAYRDQVTPLSALWVEEGRVNGGSPGLRQSDPANTAAQTFAKALRAQGIKVTAVRKATAAKSDRTIAAVSSMPLERIVEQLLLVSDNDAAEVLFRQAAIGAGRSGSFAEGRAVVERTLRTLGVWHAATSIHDGSGLSRSTRVHADTLVKVLRLAAGPKRPQLRPVVTGLPVAGVEGSLRTRFHDSASAAGIGVLHAKTGTLTGVHSLAGVVRARDGSLMVFAFLINDAANGYAAILLLDRLGGALSSCGCR